MISICYYVYNYIMDYYSDIFVKKLQFQRYLMTGNMLLLK